MNKPLQYNLTTDIDGNYRGFYLVYVQDGFAYPTILTQEEIDQLNDFVAEMYKNRALYIEDRIIGEMEVRVEEGDEDG